MLALKDEAPIILTINNRRYVICDDKIEGTAITRCGALIDVTDAKVIRITDSCGASHKRDDNPILGVD